MRQTVLVECDACHGTGLYQGFAERKGEAVVCTGCNGSGGYDLSYTLYEGRKVQAKHKSVKIRKSRGGFIATGVGGVGEAMTYNEFQKKFKERRVQ